MDMVRSGFGGRPLPRREALALAAAMACSGFLSMPAVASATSSAGTTAESNKTKKFKDIPADALIGVDDLYELVSAGALDKGGDLAVIDIRSHRDFQKYQIEGSRNIPAGRQIEIRMDEIPADKTVVLVAYKNSDRLAETYFTLLAHDYDPDLLRVLSGGLYGWMQEDYPTLKSQFLGC